jgi:hypothetical protein
MEQSDKLKQYLANSMAEIDAINFPEKTYEEHFIKNMKLRDFELLRYWIHYNGVFDGGEEMLTKLKILITEQ